MEGKKRVIILIIILLVFSGLTVFTFVNSSKKSESKVDNKKTEEKEKKKKEKKEEVDTIIDDYTNYNDNDVNINKQQNNSISVEKDNSYENALEAVNKVEENLNLDDYNAAKELVDKVTDESKKEELNKKLEDIKDSIDVKTLVVSLEDKVKSAANSNDMDTARSYRTEEEILDRVNNLSNEELKQELQGTLDELAKVLDDLDAPIISADGGTTQIIAGTIFSNDITVTVTDENEFTVVLTKDGNEMDFASGDTLSDGEYTITAKDSAFNENSITFTVDQTAPTADVIIETVSNGYRVIINPSEEINDITGFVLDGDSYVAAYQNIDDIPVSLQIEDIAGNSSTITVITFVSDVATLKDVIVNATDGDNIVLENGLDISEDITIDKTIAFIVKEINITTGKIINNGNLTIQGGIININFDGTSRIENNNKLTINGTEFNNENSESSGVIDNYGEINLNNVTITDNGNGSTIINQQNSQANIVGGTIDNTNTQSQSSSSITNLSGAEVTVTDTQINNNSNGDYAVINSGANMTLNANIEGNGSLSVNSGTLTINGGTYTGYNTYGLYIMNDQNQTNITINGGTFTGDYALYAKTSEEDPQDSYITINDGTFTGTTKSVISVNQNDEEKSCTMDITGGTYNTDPSTYVTDEHNVTEENGIYTVE